MRYVIDARDERADAFAIDLGIALQLSNVIRDVAEDAQRGRYYLPAAWVEPSVVQEAMRGETLAMRRSTQPCGERTIWRRPTTGVRAGALLISRAESAGYFPRRRILSSDWAKSGPQVARWLAPKNGGWAFRKVGDPAGCAGRLSSMEAIRLASEPGTHP